MTAQALRQKLTAVRDFAAAALFTGATVFYYHATAPETPASARDSAQHAFVDANPIRLHWLTAAGKSAKETPVQKPAFVDGKPVRFGR